MKLDGRRRSIGHVAIYGAITVVHGTDELARALLASAALTLLTGIDVVAGLRLLLLEEFLLLSVLSLVLILVPLLMVWLMLLHLNRSGLGRRWRRRLRGCLALYRALLLTRCASLL
jgi:hypothetical protein